MKQVSVKQASEIVGVSPDTIRRWSKKGLVKATRSSNGHRLFSVDELEDLHAKYSGKPGSNDYKYTVLKSKKKTGYSAVEIFCGAGGLALGLENAGIQKELLVDSDKNSISTIKHNRPKWTAILDDIKNIDFTEYKDKIDIVSGGFPCQAFSYAGNSAGFEDARGTLFYEFARCVNEIRPKIALAENVRGLLRHDGGRTFSTMIRILNQIGFDVEYRLLKSQFHNVPQKRERLILLGVRNDLKLSHIFPTEKNFTVSLRQALKDCPQSGGATYSEKKHEILKLIPPGGYWKDLPIKLQKKYMKGSFSLPGGKTGMARRLDWDEPSLTLTCNPAQTQTERCHPDETRPLTVREYARIQSFPDSWQFSGSISSQYKQIGNAVPVNLAYHLGRSVVTMLNGDYSEETLAKEGVEIQVPHAEDIIQQELPI